MMGHKEPMRGGYEYDAFVFKSLTTKRHAKKSFNKRARSIYKQQLTRETT